MAAINFVKGEQYYTAEFQINSPVNIHIERAEAGALYFRQRSIDHGSYDLINGANWNNRGDLTIDTAIQGVVYPMWIKIESASEPTLAEMVEGEQSGGGEGTESTMEYLDLRSYNLSSNDSAWIANVYLLATLVNVNGTNSVGGNTKGIFTYGIYIFMGLDVSSLLAVGLEENLTITNLVDGDKISVKEFLLKSITEEQYNSIPRITKEQFYNLEA